MDQSEKYMNHDGIELKSMEQTKSDIIKACMKVPKDVVDILKGKSSIVGVNDNSKQLKFSSYIRGAYIDIQDAFNGRTQVILEIVASVPNLKIIFLPNETNIHEYEEDEEPEFILGGITYARSETIIIAAKGYDTKEYYRKFLGVIIHEFCHFAIHETFGNNFKPYYADDKDGIAEKWDKLVNQYKSSNMDEFKVIKELFDYDKIKWVDELVVRYPQIFVEYHGSEFMTYLNEFEEIFIDLHLIYLTKVHKEFVSEKEKNASLRSVNNKSLLGDDKSKLYMNSLNKFFDMDLEAHRQVVRTNQTCLVMRNIFNEFIKDYNFKSTFMFIDITFLISDVNLKMIKEALQCRKVTNLIIDGHNDACNESCANEKLITLMRSNYAGRILLILHKTQKNPIEIDVVHHEMLEFSASDLSETFKGSLKVNFQGSSFELSSLIDSVDKITSFPFDELFQEKNYETFIKQIISIGNQHNFELNSYLEGVYHEETDGSWIELNLNENNFLKNLFDENQVIMVEINTKQLLKLKSEIIKMCGRLKQIYPNHWIVYAETLSHFLTELPDGILNITYYLAQKVLELTSIEKEIFHHFMKNGKIILLFEHYAQHNYDLNEGNCNSLETFFQKFEVHGNKICVFTLPSIAQFNGLRKLIKLKEMKKYESIEDSKMPFDNERLKTQDQFSSVIQFSRKMFDLGQEIFHFHTEENLKQNVHFNNGADSKVTLKNYDQAIEILEKSFRNKFCPKIDLCEEERYLNLWGHILLNQGKYLDAEEKFEEAKQLRLEDANISEVIYLLDKAECRYKSNKYIESIKMIDEALKIGSHSRLANGQLARAFSLRGFVFQEQKLDVEALQAFERAINLSKDENLTEKRKFHLINIANAYRGGKDYEKSVELMKEAIKIESETEYLKKLDSYSMSLWGHVLYEQKSYTAAIEKYEKAFEFCTDEWVDEKKINLNLAAVCYKNTKKYNKAIKFIEKALKIESETAIAIEENLTSLNLWGFILIIQRNYIGAISKFESAFKLCTHDIKDKKKMFFNNAAYCYYGLKQYDKAIEFTEKALQIESDTKTVYEQNTQSLSFLGSILRYHKNYTGAIHKLERALELCTDEMIDKKKIYLNNMAICFYDLKDYYKAIEFLEQALKIESNTESAIEQNVKSFDLWGITLTTQKNYMKSIEKFESAFKLCTNEMIDKKKLLLTSLADCYYNLKQFEKAIKFVEQALKSESNTETAIEQKFQCLNLWGLTLTAQKNHMGAIKKFESAFKLCTDEMIDKDKKKILLHNSADCYYNLKQYDKAIKLIEQALKIKSNAENAIEHNFQSLKLWGLILMGQKNYTEAIEKFDNAFKLCKDEMNGKKKFLLNSLAEGYFKLEKYDEAIKLIKQAIQIESITENATEHTFQSMNLWGLILTSQKNYMEAIEKFESAIKLCPDEMMDMRKVILNNFADCYYKLTNYDKAIKLIEQALKIESNTETAIKQKCESLHLWGLILTNQKNYTEAIEKFDGAVELCTDEEMNDRKEICLNNMVSCYYELANYDKAIKMIERALETELINTKNEIIQKFHYLNRWGLILTAQQNHMGAIEKFESAFNLCTDEMIDRKKICLNNLADCNLNLKQCDKAIKLIEQALQIDLNSEAGIEHNCESFYLWGLILYHQKSYTQAVKKFETALELCTGEMIERKKMYLNCSAQCYHTLKNNKKAIKLIEQSLEIELKIGRAIEHNCQSFYLWGLILNDQKNYKEAIEKFDKAVKLCTDKMNDKKKIYLKNLVKCHHVLKILNEVKFIKKNNRNNKN